MNRRGRPNRFWAGLLLMTGLSGLAPTFAQSASMPAAAAKRALLVGINDYKSVPGLQGSVNDVQTMREVLITRWGFQEANIRMVTDQAATRAGILAALEELVRTAGPNDTVYFHYSGHGSQVEDLNGDEEDGLDETIVPVDGRSPGVPDIVDDELDAIFARLKTRSAVIVLDSCHSGTATRALDIRARSVPQDRRIDLYKASSVHTRAIVPRMSSRYLVMSAAASNEEALDGPVEGRYHGFFSYALARSMSASPPGASAREVFGGVARELNRIQAQFGRASMPEPQLEASSALIQQPLFAAARAAAGPAAANSGAGGQPPRLAWLDIQPSGGAEALLIKGALLGAAPGSTWAVYPAGETAFLPGRALAIATVTELRGADAMARIEPSQRILERGSRGVALMPAPAAGKIGIGMLNVPAERRREIEAVLNRDIRNVSVVGPGAPASFLVDMQGDSLRLLTAAGLQVVGIFPAGSNQWGAGVANAVARMANAAELLALDNPAAQLAVIAHVAGRQPFATRGIAVVADTQAAQLHVRRSNEPRAPSNSLQLEVSVNADAFITIVDVDSEGGVNLLFPNDYQQRSFYGDGGVRAADRVLIPDSLQPGNRAGFYWDYSPPRGIDTLRIFASTDLATANIIRQRVLAMRRPAAPVPGMATRAITQDVGRLRDDLLRLATRGIAVRPGESVQPDSSINASGAFPDWAATSISVQVSDGE